jgi:hypothetical protein
LIDIFKKHNLDWSNTKPHPKVLIFFAHPLCAFKGALRIKKVTQPHIASTFASPHKPTHKPKAYKRACNFAITLFSFNLGYLLF